MKRLSEDRVSRLLISSCKYLGRLLPAVILLSAFGSLGVTPASAVERLQVLALFTDKAMIRVDGKNILLKAGETGAEGVKLISANAREAVVEVKGEQSVVRLGEHVGTGFQQPEAREVRILPDATGAFMITGAINGRMVDMMVDTGATVVAMGASEAKRIGIPYRMEGRPVSVNTAAGMATGYLVALDRVQVGEIILRNVNAAVIDGAGPPKVLLGMSFLNQVDMQNQGRMLLLRKRN